MTNPYYTPGSAIQPYTIADARDVTAEFAAVQAGFDAVHTALSANNLSATSATSVVIGTGTRVFSISPGKAFAIGQFIVIASQADPTNFMRGQVIAPSDMATGTLVVSVSPGGTGGSGTYADWSIALDIGASGSLYLPKAGGAMSGPIALPGDPTLDSHAARKGYVDAAIAALVNAAPGTLDTLAELAAALGNDANFATSVATALAGKANAAHTHTAGEVSGITTGYTQIAQLTTTSGTSQTFTSIPQTYSDLLFVPACSSNSGANEALRLAISDDGTNWSGTMDLGGSLSGIAGTGTAHGGIIIPGYTKGRGVLTHAIQDMANRSLVGGPNYGSNVGAAGSAGWRADGGIVAARFTWSGGSAFDTGTITLYGR